MSQDRILLDLDAVEQRLVLFNSTFPSDSLEAPFNFSSKESTSENLDRLAGTILHSRSIAGHVFLYKSIFLEIVARWTKNLKKKDYVLVIEKLASIITIFPSAMPLIEDYLDKENDHFITILQNPSSQKDSDMFKILLAYYRLLYHNKEVFARFIQPDILYQLVDLLAEHQESQVIIFLALKVLSLYLDMGEKAITDMLDAYIKSNDSLLGRFEGDFKVDYSFLELNEAKRFSNFSKLPCVPECFTIKKNHSYLIIEPQDLNIKVASICGVIVPKVHTTHDKVAYPLTFVPTQKTVSSLRQLGRKIQNSAPVMLIGKAGSGKTFLINELSKYMGCHDSIVKIHLGEQTDAKLLIGTYTSGDKPGTFEWRAGVLATAVKEGRWVLIEDIDKAPTDVLSILLSLLEKRELVIPSRGETVKAANGFQLISTVRINEDHPKQNSNGSYNLNIIGMRIWNVIELEEPSEEDLTHILAQKFPVLKNLIPKLIDSYKSVKSIYLNTKFISLNKGAHTRVVSVRDLIKLCERLDVLFKSNGINKPDQLIESSVYDSVFSEAADCFAGAIGEFKALEPIIQAIGESLDIASSRISLFLTQHVPTLENLDDSIKIGRALLLKEKLNIQKKSVNSTSFAFTNHSLRLMEQISVCMQMTEPVLLVGETGTGKTTVVQQLAKMLAKTLTVINVSQQTETGDLLGGYKPVNSKTVAVPIQETFETLFNATFSLKKNEKFHKMLHRCFNKNQWKNVVKLWNEAYKMAQSILKITNSETENESTKKKKRRLNTHEKKLLLDKWADFNDSVKKFEAQSSSIENSFVFNFVEGSLVKAIRAGGWLLLDEVNLATADTLESISDLLTEPNSRSILLSEKGDAEPIKAHPDFRIFACMNPATDVGKKDLPMGIRSRFTEIYVHSPERDITDLLSIIDKYIGKYSVSDEWVGNDIAELYLEAKKLADSNTIVDGSNQKPHFSIRTLTRTLLYVTDIIHIYGLRRSLYDGFCMSFLTLLDQKSEAILKPVIEKFALGRLKNVKSVMSQTPPSPGPEYVQFKHYWMKRGPNEVQEQAHYIITPFVEKNMMNLVRATSGKRFPVLIQGPTSSGKTSMIKYLADITGHKFVRINNHEHTDLQEYLGTYVTDDTGKLSFKEGVLVEALRKGYWIVLDELNLAPTDVLEALNRLLDDNRELFIPETQEIVHPHPDFLLFATQNPPGIYGGRKILSRAFRNRFLELHFDDIPQDELEIILRERCKIAPSYAKKIVEVYRQLSIERSASRLFEQKNSFATLRDLFRWALRDAVGYEQLAASGYMLLAERCRTPQEKVTVKKTLEKVMKVKLDMDQYYASLEDKSLEAIGSVTWTKGMRRLSVLVSSCLKNKEPVLLVGETGCGKTTICQLLAQFMGRELITLNAHQNTETGDILGAQRPVRNRSEIQHKLIKCLKTALNVANDKDIDLQELLQLYSKSDDKNITEDVRMEIKKLRDSLNVLFEWSDGPLIQAMKTGNFFLLDEISLADDSVLERLNSVLEPERSLLLAEQGSSDSLVTASENFQFFATMNPGGDYGKKELSPALRNRFTEIWVPSMEDFNDVNMIVSSRLLEDLKNLADPIVNFSEWFGKKLGGGNATSGVISLRDILAWVEFINKVYPKINNKSTALIQGASMVFIDALGTNNTAYLAENENDLKSLRTECVVQLLKLCGDNLELQQLEANNIIVTQDELQVGMFKIPRFPGGQPSSFNLTAPTTASNLVRVVRAMQVHKPILLEGSPGVGKTSLITALANITGNKLTRINLSEQTDLVDLFGADAPGERSGEFLWHDAPFLRAMKKGEWVLLDEMNLASQSVLEGLNACLDHRGEAYIPELDISFTCHPNFLVFAAQNPQYQGGGRKGLPKSFVNRFSVVFIDMLTSDDLLLIAKHLYPSISPDVIAKMIKLMSTLEEQVCKKKLWGNSGSPWEFNLRDTLRWLKLLNQYSICDDVDVFDFVNIIVKQRFRTSSDKNKAQLLIEDIFGGFSTKENFFKLTEEYIQINNEVALRSPHYRYPITQNLFPLECNVAVYESVLKAINNNWPLVLVGPSNSGKTETIRFLASILGPRVDVFSMNSDIDSMDILGGYEQVDLTRKISYITEDITNTVREIISTNMKLLPNAAAIIEGLNLLKYLLSDIVTPEKFQGFRSRFNKFSSHLEGHSSLKTINMNIEKMSEIITKEASVKFEWFDGMLVKAVEKGHWLILDNANLCSPSVLDRLNSLLETDGSLLINECSQEDGQPRVLKPHPNFRLFLTMDPKYGELSRAMRNRGVEIYIEELPNRSTAFDCLTLGLEVKKTDTDFVSIDDGIKKIELNESNTPMPLKHFVPSYLSRPCIFAQVHDIILLSDEAPLEESLAAVIPISSLGKVDKWANNILNCMEYSEKNIVEKLYVFIKFFTDMGILEKINNLYAPATLKLQGALGIHDKQLTEETLSLTLNEYVLPTISKYSDKIKSPESLYLLSTLGLLLNSLNALKSINAKSTHGKIDELTYIELSAAAFNGRHLKNTPRIPIFCILYNISTVISENFKTKSLFCGSNQYQHYWDLLVIVIAALETATTKDEARLRVYKELIDNWIASAKTKSDIEITPFLNINSEFTDVLHLSRGHSITLLWDTFRKNYPTTSNSWLAFEKLIELSKKFDRVRLLQFSESYSSIQDLMDIFRLLNEDVLDNNLPEFNFLLSKLEDGISELELISSKFLNKRKHYFATEFDNLIRYTFSVDTVELIKELAPASSLATEKLTKLIINKYNYPPVFDVLWTENNAKLTSFTSSIFSSQFLEDVVRKSNNLKTFSGNQIKQSISDAELLLSSTIKCSPNLLKSQVECFENMLMTWLRRIIDIHAGRDCSKLSLKEISSLIEEKTASETCVTFAEYILPALELIESSKSLEALGEAWILFGTGLLLLFVPDSPYDPAIHDYVLYDLFLKTKTFSQNLMKSWRNVRKVISGDEKIFTEELINVISDEDAPQSPRVYRTDMSIDCLFDEWIAFLTSTMSSQQIKELVGAYECNSDQSDRRLEMLQQNSFHFLNRLESGYSKFADLNDILAGYIYSINFGFDLLKLQKSKDRAIFQISPLWSMDPINISCAENVLSAYHELSKFFKKSTVEDSSVEKVLMYFLMLFKFHRNDTILLEIFEATLYTLYSRWSLRRFRQEQEENEKSSMFKFSDNSDDYETDFKNLFPDYEDTVLVTDEKDASSPENLDEIYFQLADTYISVFDRDHDANFSSELKSGAMITTILSEKLENTKIEELRSGSLSAVINRLDEETQSFKNAKDFGDIDFYHDFSIPEFQKASDIIETVLKSVLKLLEQWPEHATLNELYRVSQEFLNYPIQTPLARQLQKIEQIYTFLAEWEKYASSEVSLNTTLKLITDLIVSWRKLELRTWKGLFNSEDEKTRKSIGKWWFYLYESIVISNLGNEKKETTSNTTLLVSSLNLFFSKSTLGEFNARLDLVKAFYKHIQLIGLRNSKIEGLLHNTLKFYYQFKPVIDERIASGRKSLEKEIDDIILLASWKDVNVDALKQSSRKSHNNLYKIVRKYRDLLGGDAKTIIEAGLSYTNKNKFKLPTLRQHFYEDLNLEASKNLVKKISSWSTRPASLKNIDMVTSNMDSYLENISSQEFPNFADLASDFYAEAERLRKETPDVYTKENKKRLAYLKTQKSKVLGDALKELRRIGLKGNFREDIQKVQSSTTTILANIAPFNDKYLDSADAFFFKVLDLLPKLRSAVSNPSDDIPVAAIERGMALTQSLMFSLITVRHPLSVFANDYCKVNDMILDLECFTHLKGDIVHCSLKTDIDNVRLFEKWLPSLLDYAAQTLSVISKYSTTLEQQKVLLDAKSTLSSFFLHFNTSRVFDSSFIESYFRFELFINELLKKLENAKEAGNAFVFDTIIEWIKTNKRVPIKKEQKRGPSVEEIEQAFRRTFTSIILSFQKVIGDGFESISETDDKWLSTSFKKIMINVKLLRSGVVSKNIEAALSLLKSFDFATTESIYIKSIISFTLPVITRYCNAMTVVLDRSRNYYTNTSHGTYILSTILHSLAKNGFCSPEPPSEEVDDKNLQDGTGLGDGEGAQNNNKDVEQDEDLTEDAQKENKDQQDKNEREDENEDDAVEMEGDMAGELEDLSNGEENENDDEHTDSEEEELDEEIDDLNEDDPNAIDDKMWDEKASDNSKEKDTDQNLDGKNQEEDVQAAENDEQQQDSKEGVDEDSKAPEDGDEEIENDEDAEDENDVGEQEDEVKDEQGENLEANVPEIETLDLPEDMNLDSDREESDGDIDMSDEMPDDLNKEEAENENEEVKQEAGNEDDNEDDESDSQIDVNEAETAFNEEKDAEEDVNMTNDEGKENEENVPEEQVMSDEELKQDDGIEDDKEKGGEQNTEGLDGVEEKADIEDIDQEAAVQQDSGSKGAGADATDTREQEDVGGSGTTQNTYEEDQEDLTKNNEESREEATAALKQLGDSLKEYHRRRQDIKEAQTNDEENDNLEKRNERPDEFEHVEGANTETDTQALGSATQDQLQTIDENMAIDDDREEQEVDQKDLAEESDNEKMDIDEEDMLSDVDEHDANNGTDSKKSGFIGERKTEKDLENELPNEHFLPDQEDKDELQALIENVEDNTHDASASLTPERSLEESRELWHKSEISTAELVSRLGEQLRLILEPTLATKLKGDYKTGKRLNMKRIIPYIASQFRKDKIWLRRTKPSKRQYQIMIALDDSKSMSESKCVKLAFDSLCLVSRTLTQLEAGGLSIVKFGENAKEVHSFDQQFSNESGARAFQWFGFQETKTDVKKLVAESIKIFERARAMAHNDQWQLEIVISDGICEDHETIQRLVRRARENKIMLVFVIIDGITSNESILDMSQVNYIPDQFGNPQLKITKYLDTFPFEFYVVVHDISELPEMLSLILRQYFTDLASN
ncbi:AAA family ATPase midasin [Saccharomyces paradoxus]|uniref:Midasin n=1 Tax=Saccharomyces paradoxus TaxID=27291 RepID=A0A8B8UVT4_SACPA|nr:Mdn1 [Saccharomyces paradoxus]QHS74848.1 Mdn1 [Saccharomyces paradoxus]